MALAPVRLVLPRVWVKRPAGPRPRPERFRPRSHQRHVALHVSKVLRQHISHKHAAQFARVDSVIEHLRACSAADDVNHSQLAARSVPQVSRRVWHSGTVARCEAHSAQHRGTVAQWQSAQHRSTVAQRHIVRRRARRPQVSRAVDKKRHSESPRRAATPSRSAVKRTFRNDSSVTP